MARPTSETAQRNPLAFLDVAAVRLRRNGVLHLLCSAVLLALAWPVACAAEEPPPPGWRLIWHDEFTGARLDRTKWSRCARGSADWDAMMSPDPRLIELKDGVLRLRGIVNTDRTRDPSAFLTAGLTSQGKFAFHHGRLEVRARFRSAQGAWPALWLLGSGKEWPEGGEIDVMEHLNFENAVYQTIHTPYTEKSKPDDSSHRAAIRRDDFNIYAVEWDEDAIRFFINGRRSFTYRRNAAQGPWQWPFDRPMHLLLTMQIGGDWVGKPNPAHYPAWMEVDWVRVYTRNNRP